MRRMSTQPPLLFSAMTATSVSVQVANLWRAASASKSRGRPVSQCQECRSNTIICLECFEAEDESEVKDLTSCVTCDAEMCGDCKRNSWCRHCGGAHCAVSSRLSPGLTRDLTEVNTPEIVQARRIRSISAAFELTIVRPKCS